MLRSNFPAVNEMNRGEGWCSRLREVRRQEDTIASKIQIGYLQTLTGRHNGRGRENIVQLKPVLEQIHTTVVGL